MELCSSNRVKNNYDGLKTDGEFAIKKVDYVGVPCDCIGLKSAESCKHSIVVSDNGVINYYLNILNSNTK